MVVLEDGSTKAIVTCTISTTTIVFDEMDVNRALELPTENFDEPVKEKEIVEFLELIYYASTYNLARLNKKHLRRE